MLDTHETQAKGNAQNRRKVFTLLFVWLERCVCVSSFVSNLSAGITHTHTHKNLQEHFRFGQQGFGLGAFYNNSSFLCCSLVRLRVCVSCLIDFYVPLMVGLPLTELVLKVESLGGTDLFEGFQNARHHALESTKVNDGTLAEFLQQQIGFLCQHMLHIELSTIDLVSHFPRNGIINPQLTRTCCVCLLLTITTTTTW